MKLVLTQAEIKQIVADHLAVKFITANPFECTGSPSYSDWTFEEATPEFLEAKAKNEVEMEAFRVKWAKEAKAKEVANNFVDKAVAAQLGNG